MCYTVPFVELAVSHESVLTILAITAERYYAICRPLQAGEVRLTKTKACLTCLVTWVIAFTLTAPILAIVKYEYVEKPGLDTNYLISFFYFTNCWFILYSQIKRREYDHCLFGRVLEKSHIGAKSDFEIWVFKVFFFGPEKKLQRRLAGGHT